MDFDKIRTYYIELKRSNSEPQLQGSNDEVVIREAKSKFGNDLFMIYEETAPGELRLVYEA